MRTDEDEWVDTKNQLTELNARLEVLTRMLGTRCLDDAIVDFEISANASTRNALVTVTCQHVPYDRHCVKFDAWKAINNSDYVREELRKAFPRALVSDGLLDRVEAAVIEVVLRDLELRIKKERDKPLIDVLKRFVDRAIARFVTSA